MYSYYINSRMSQEHIADLRRAADRSRLSARPRTAAHRLATIRNRVGWTLVHLGLWLVFSPADGC